MDITFTLAQTADIETLIQFMREYCAFAHLPFMVIGGVILATRC